MSSKVRVSCYNIKFRDQIRIYVWYHIDPSFQGIQQFLSKRKELYTHEKYFILRARELYEGFLNIEEFDFISDVQIEEIDFNDVSKSFIIRSIKKEVKEAIAYYENINNTIKREKRQIFPIKGLILAKSELLNTSHKRLIKENKYFGGVYKDCSYYCLFSTVTYEKRESIYVFTKIGSGYFNKKLQLVKNPNNKFAPVIYYVSPFLRVQWSNGKSGTEYDPSLIKDDIENPLDRYKHEKYRLLEYSIFNRGESEEYHVIDEFEFISNLNPLELNKPHFEKKLIEEVEEAIDFYISISKSLGVAESIKIKHY
jgi:hypothetical protein